MSSNTQKTQEVFDTLKDWLIHHGYITEKSYRLKLRHDPLHDMENERDPRCFCYVQKGRDYVFYSEAICALPLIAQCGILLHEIMHVEHDLFDGDPTEVDVDVQCTAVKEAGYKYHEKIRYVSPWTGRPVSAKMLESVSPTFINKYLGV